MATRKLVAYAMVLLIVGLLAAWQWQSRRRVQALRRERHGERLD